MTNKYYPEILIDTTARFGHAILSELCRSLGEEPYPAWDDPAAEKHRETSRAGAIDALGGGTAESSHETWMQGKLDDGWEWAEVTDKPNKKHADLVPYSQLTPKARCKDEVWPTAARLARQTLGMAGLLPPPVRVDCTPFERMLRDSKAPGT